MSAATLDSTFPPAPSPKALGGRPRPHWASEVLAVPAALLFEFPLAPRLALHVPGVEGIVRVTADGEVEESELVLDVDEWRALVLGVEADRVWPADFALFCRRKRDEPAYRIEAFDALAGGQPDPDEAWELGAVLDQLGVELLSVEVG